MLAASPDHTWRAADDETRLWQKFRLEWNFHSNHIEGNTLTYGETELFFLHDKIQSGHTHRDAWIPADAKFPYGQLVSGGPKMEAARWIEGKADASGLTLVMRDLAGATVHEVKLPRA